MKNVKARVAAVVALAVATAIGAVALDLGGMSASAANPTSVTINGQTHAISGVNVRRTTDSLIQYTPAFGATTGTNEFGFEAAVVNDVVTQTQNSVGNMAIPAGGYVLSGHGTSRTWLLNNAHVGDTVVLDGTTSSSPPPTSSSPPPGGTQLLPDIGIRTLRNFTIVTPTSGAYAGKKLLKFPGVTSNIGKGPLEVVGHRSSSTSSDWVATQHIYTTTGGIVDSPAPDLTFYYAGDGHNHWHMKDFDAYEMFDPSGHKVATGEKHGFCFEDNTSYRDWPQKHTNGAPGSPVYDPSKVCGVGQPSTTDIMHGLSVGWGDTYPASLPDQAIDITGLPNGNYTVKITADAAGNIKESNESNNSASALVKIQGNSVTLLSANDGL